MKHKRLGRFLLLGWASLFLIQLVAGSKEKVFSPHGREIVANELLVKLRDDVALPSAGSFHADMGAKVLKRFSNIPGVSLVRIEREGSLEAAIESYKRSGIVEALSYNYIRRASVEPNDALYGASLQWGLNNEGELGGVADADIDAPEAWDTISDASDVIVAVIDTGVRYTHEDLAGNMWVNPGEIPGNGIDDDGNTFIDDIHGINSIDDSGDPIDDQGHGTHVAGILGAVGNNGIGIAGTAWNVKIMALKFLDAEGAGRDSDAIECINYAISKGARIINNSWGAEGFNTVLEQAIRDASDAGVLFVAASGNESNDNDANPSYPSSYELPNVVSVTATDKYDEFASFANFGENSVDIAAPGVGVYSTYIGSDLDYRALSGTSMAAPYVSGALALLIGQFPNESISSIQSRLYATSDTLASLARRCRTGGRLNLARALLPDLPAPINDQFENAAAISGSPAISSGFNAAATSQSDEPSHASGTSDKSVWWKWIPTTNGLTEISTVGSDFLTALAVYRGSDLNALTLVASDIDEGPNPQGSNLSFEAISGEDYYIAVDGIGGGTGNISLTIGQGVTNDDFASSEAIEGINIRATSNNGSATSENDEPNHAPLVPASRSVWWSWTAPLSGDVTVSTSASNSFDTVLSVYTGDTLASLQQVASDDDSGPGWTSELTFTAQKDTTYRIAVDGWNDSFGAIALTVASGENDDFSNARPYISDTFNDIAFTGLATKESNEPLHGENQGGRSLWWDWTATRNGQAYISTFGSDFDTTLGVYQGAGLGQLIAVDQSDDAGGTLTSRVIFDAVFGQTYRIAVDGFNGELGQDFGLVQIEGFVEENPSWKQPVIDNTGALEALFGEPTSIQVVAEKNPTSYSASGLPSGLSIDSLSGLISGTPTSIGTHPVELRAANTFGEGVLLTSINVLPTEGPPVIDALPVGIAKPQGETVLLEVMAYGVGQLSYQWNKDGFAIPGATSSTYSISNLSESNSGVYTVTVSNSDGATVSEPIQVSIASNYLLNISSRGYASSGEGIMIAGFTVEGTEVKDYLIRAVGPTLVTQGVVEVLEKPLLQLFKDGTPVATARSWVDQANSSQIESVSSQMGAFPLESPDDAAMLVSLEPGQYGALIFGDDGGSGVTLAEVYDVSTAQSVSTRLINISSRQYTGSGEKTAIAGFIVEGQDPKRVLVRVIGPSLVSQGVSSPLPDPVLQIFAAGQLHSSNDNWEDSDSETMNTAFNDVGAFSLPEGSLDAAMVATLPPGTYGVIVTDKNGADGICLLEVYEY